MRAVVFEKPSTGQEFTSVEDVALPTLAPNEVAIDVEYAGINYIDVMARRGDPGYASSWPYVPGLEVAGRVREVGEGVTGFVPGERVAAFTRGGGLAEVAHADQRLVARIPSSVEAATAAATPLMLSTAMLLLRDVANFRGGDTVLMHAAGGGIGSAIAQLVPALGGGRLIGTVGVEDKIAAALSGGWQHVLVRDAHLGSAVKELAGDGADVILDPLGTQMLPFDLDHIAPGGRIVLFGNPSGEAMSDLPPAGRLIGGNTSIGGFSMSRLTATAPHKAKRALEDVLALLDSGAITMPVIVSGSFEDVAPTHERLAAGESEGKYVIKVPL